LDLSSLQEDLRKLGVGLALGGIIGWFLQDGNLNAIFTGTSGIFLWSIGLIRIVRE